MVHVIYFTQVTFKITHHVSVSAACLKLARKAVVFVTEVCIRSIQSKECGIFLVHIASIVMSSCAVRHPDDSHPLAGAGMK